MIPALLVSCGWVDSTGRADPAAELRYQQLTGVNDIVDLVGEEPYRLDTAWLLLQSRRGGVNLGDENSSHALEPQITWKRVGNLDTSECPHFNNDQGIGVSLLQACASDVYDALGSLEGSTVTDAVAATQCELHILEVEAEPGVYELHAPAVIQPVVLHYDVIVHTEDRTSRTTPLTICLQPE